MSRRFIFFRHLIGTSFLWFIIVSCTFAGNYDEKFRHQVDTEKRFTVKEGQSLILDSDLGTVTIVGTSGNEVIIKVTKGANRVSEDRAEEMFDRFELDFRQTGSGVEVYGEYDRPGFWRSSFWSKLKVVYDIRIPEDFDLDIVTSGGSINVEQVAGEITLRTSGGSLNLYDVDGPVIAKTSGGSVTAKKVSGREVYLKTSGGSIRVTECEGSIECSTSGGSITADGVSGSLDAHTSGGSIRLNNISGEIDATTSGGGIKTELIGQPKGPISLKTSGGSVTLYMDDDVKAEIDARTSGGRVNVDFPVTVRGKFSKSQLRGEVNGGGPMILLRTSGGGIHIQRR
ncbi:MAG: DUF4097 family beta strand repeat-containing protein [bacterium]